jgi:hypothetical protein
MNHSLGLAIESLVAVLLVLTICYCMVLNARLKRLKADEHSLKAVIGELITATEIAERAIGGLKHTVRDVNEHLGGQLTAATQMSEHLKRQLAEGDQVVRRLTKIAIAARPQSMAGGQDEEPASGFADGAAARASSSFLPPSQSSSPQSSSPKVSSAKAVAAAAQAFSDRRRSAA